MLLNSKVRLSIYLLVINPTNARVFKLKLSRCARGGTPLRKSFNSIPGTKILH